MAALLPDAARSLAAAALLYCCTAVAAPTGKLELPRPSKDQPIDLVAASSDVDYKNNTLLFRQVRITQGPLKVEAQEAAATGLNFENSEWTLTGQVKITMPDGKLSSSDAKVNFRNNEIAQAVVHGTPAEFEQKLKDTQQLARGHANTIEYNVQAGTVKLTGAAWLTDGDNVIQGDTLIYDVAKQRVAANPGGTDPGGVHITINPKTQDKSGSKDKPKTPATDKAKPPKGQPSQ